MSERIEPSYRLPSLLEKSINTERLTKDEEFALFESLKNNDPRSELARVANDTLVLRSLGLVWHVAKKHTKGLITRQPQVDDAFQEGVLGLMHGLTKFNASRKHRLSTYVGWWIRQYAVRQTLRQREDVAIQGNMLVKCGALARATNKIIESGRLPPSDAELAKVSKFSEWKIANVRKAQTTRVVFLDARINSHLDDDVVTRKDILPDPNGQPDEPYRPKQVALIGQALDVLDTNERFIIENHFGFGDRDVQGVKWCGKQLGISNRLATATKARAMDKILEAVRMPPKKRTPR